MRLSHADLRAVLQSIELLTSDLDPESMPIRTECSLRGLISSDVIFFEAFGSDNHYQGPLWYSPVGSVERDRLKVIADHVQEHALLDDVLTNRRRRGIRLSGYLSLSQFKRTLLYNEFFRFLNTDRQLTVGLEINKRLTITTSLCRLRSDFTDRDCAAIELLTPHLETAFRSSQFISELKRRSVSVNPNSGTNINLVSVNPDMVRYESNPAAQILFTKYFGTDSTVLPAELEGISAFTGSNFVTTSFICRLNRFTRNGPTDRFE